ncbi:MAG: hypothetical protein GFH27_549307n208 [Chloroflexi bacterium AL-W]|nr:hypothetical protein [Chloroflexi bacterium AL-N1]NOK69241.1 hypothetical protein [Chloroflexi bacterium AL-N10]NOK77224.1 hypothetical protein [Chloroflexi bacterium AL-N5]NOK83868.1 hypothetical protein [Chloroflexi bacterium AL-W]NOK91079.1 hypothetical protein [Chloroflexi bacterium AL-N15]
MLNTGKPHNGLRYLQVGGTREHYMPPPSAAATGSASAAATGSASGARYGPTSPVLASNLHHFAVPTCYRRDTILPSERSL